MAIEDMKKRLPDANRTLQSTLDVAELQTRRCLVVAAGILADVTQGTVKGGSIDQLIAIAGIVSASMDSFK